MTQAKPATPKQARDWLGALAHAAAYADACGRPTKAEHLLTPEAIEWYPATGCLHLGDASRSNRRCRLNNLRRALLGPDLVTGEPAAYSGSDSSRPYSRSDQAQLYASARAQPTEELRYGLLTLPSPGFGCALAHPRSSPCAPMTSGKPPTEPWPWPSAVPRPRGAVPYARAGVIKETAE
ncbi:hypothetical protein [Streptomyces sp. DG1A-41]|uniref:hypothetical protein n=1 Tax=Streptomyces sp. DG1A-41 TaxID=3125779 RepID=UPI0030D4A27D